MDRPLFVYGTLRDPDLLAAVLGRRPDARNMAPATAPGFRTVTYPGRPYPALLRAPGAAADGAVLVGLTRLERTILDAYEGEEYLRTLIPVIVEGELHEADAYLPTASIGPDAEPWSLPGWQQTHKAAVFEAESRAAAEIRAQLKAARAR